MSGAFKLLITASDTNGMKHGQPSISTTIAEFDTPDKANVAAERLRALSNFQGGPIYHTVRLYDIPWNKDE